MTFDEIEKYMSMSIDISRLENMFMTQINTLYYAPMIGLDWNYWLKSEVSYQNQTVETWLKQEALKNNVLTSSIALRQDGFDLLIDYRIASEQEQQTITVRSS